MAKLWLTGTACVLVLSFFGEHVASADPDLGPLINTTCSYAQVVGAVHAQNPAAAAQLAASPSARAVLRSFLDSPPDERLQIIQELQGYPGAQQYVGPVLLIANTCNNF